MRKRFGLDSEIYLPGMHSDGTVDFAS